MPTGQWPQQRFHPDGNFSGTRKGLPPPKDSLPAVVAQGLAVGEVKWHIWRQCQPWARVWLRAEVGDALCGRGAEGCGASPTWACSWSPFSARRCLLRLQGEGRFLAGSKFQLVSLAHHGASRSMWLHGESPRLFSWRRKSFLQLKPATARGDLGAGRRSPVTPAHPAVGKPAAAGHGQAVLGLDPPLWRNSLKFSKFQTSACMPL